MEALNDDARSGARGRENSKPNLMDVRAPGIPVNGTTWATYTGFTGEVGVCLRIPVPQVQRPARGAPAFGASRLSTLQSFREQQIPFHISAAESLSEEDEPVPRVPHRRTLPMKHLREFVGRFPVQL